MEFIGQLHGGEGSIEIRTLEERQGADPTLNETFHYQEEGILPSEDQKARLLVLNKANYTVVNGILHRVAPDNSLHISLQVATIITCLYLIF